MVIVTNEQMRQLDAAAIHELGIPSVALMENAGKAIADQVLLLCAENKQLAEDTHWAILVGKGNNGGDGLVAARHLMDAGAAVTLIYAEPPEVLRGDARVQEQIVKLLGIPELVYGQDLVKLDQSRYTGIIDALLGTGASGAPRGAYAELITAANASKLPIVSADIPSGLQADTGEVNHPCIRATVTVCLAFLKRGLVQYPGAEAAGRVITAPIGIPSLLCKQLGIRTYLLTEEVLSKNLKIDLSRHRSPDSHKGTFGHVLLAAGSLPMSGAGLLSARAALRAGSGLVTWALPDALLPLMAGHSPELMLAAASENAWNEASAERVLELASARDVLALGPGMGRFQGDGSWLKKIWEGAECPLVIDADGLNMLAAVQDRMSWKRRERPVILTPHPGEMARLAGISTAEVQRDRFKTALDYAREHKVIVVLKGARTIIASPDGAAYVNTTGHPGMATGGSGDVLTGLIAGLLAQGLSAVQSAAFGVYLHGLAGERAAARRGHPSSLLAGDLIEAF